MKFIYKIMLPCFAAVFLIAITLYASPVSVMAADDTSSVDDYVDGLPYFPADIYGHHYMLVSSKTTSIDTVEFFLFIFDDISIVTSDYTADEIVAGSHIIIRGMRDNGVRYWYKYSFEDGWVKGTRVLDEFVLYPSALRVNSVTFDVPLTSDPSIVAIPANTEVISNKKHIDGLGRLIFGSIDLFDSNYLGIMPLVCMISSAVVVFVHRMIGRGF